jgi:hypothetical protein
VRELEVLSGVFLSGTKLFYRVMADRHYYPYSNPLVDNLSVTLSKVEEKPPRMPDISGVVLPDRKQRLSDSYFKLEGDTWIPKVIDDPALPIQVLRGGEHEKSPPSARAAIAGE